MRTIIIPQAFAESSDESFMLTFQARNVSRRDSESQIPFFTHQDSRILCIPELKNLCPEA